MTGDEAILELFFARSEQGIRELDERYGRVLRGLSRHILNDPQDAEECVNDAYLGAWNAIPPARPDPLLAYLCRVVRNISLRAYYKKKAAKRDSAYTVAMEELEPCLAGPDRVEEEPEARELARTIEGFLETLDPENRVLFMRRYWFADSYREIAERMGLTEKTVSVRLTRIRGSLRKYLEQNEVLV